MNYSGQQPLPENQQRPRIGIIVKDYANASLNSILCSSVHL